MANLKSQLQHLEYLVNESNKCQLGTPEHEYFGSLIDAQLQLIDMTLPQVNEFVNHILNNGAIGINYRTVL